MKKERKQRIVDFLGSIDKMILSTIFHNFVNRAWETIEFKDNLEYHVEKLQIIIKKSSFQDLIETLKKKKLNEQISSQFLARHSKQLFKRR